MMAVLLTTGLFFSCQEDLLDPEVGGASKLKSETIDGIPMSGTLPGGALYEISLPETWEYLPSKILLVYAHGYKNPDTPVELPTDVIPDGMGGTIPIKDFVLNTLNMGYASTSYRANGLVVVDAITDLVELRATIEAFFDESNPMNPGYTTPSAVILVGPSEGGLITVLTIEQNPGLFDAAMATCCPIGDFYGQLQYYGDAHVLFKYFFGPSFNDINLGSPKRISKNTMDAWNSGILQAGIVQALQNDYLYNGGDKIRQYLACANIPADVSNPEAVIKAILEVLRFPIMATNDAIDRLGGNPYNNKFPMREYSGSDNDRKLNLTVERIYDKDWPTAAQNVAAYYETSGMLQTPLITMHNLSDHVSLYYHQLLYGEKVSAFGMTFPGGHYPVPPFFDPVYGVLIHIPATNQYGHCNFLPQEIIAALGSLPL